LFDTYSDLLDMYDLQSALEIGRTSAYKLINSGALKHIRVGKSIRIPKVYLVDFIHHSCYNDEVIANLPSV